MNGWKLSPLPIVGMVGPLVQTQVPHMATDFMTGSRVRSALFMTTAEIVVDDLIQNMNRGWIRLERKYPAVGEGVGWGIRQEAIFNAILYHTEVPAVDYDLYMNVVDLLGARGIPVVTRETRDANIAESYDRLTLEQRAKVDLICTTWPKNRKVARSVREEVFRRYPNLREWFKGGKYILKERTERPVDSSVRGIARALGSLVNEVNGVCPAGGPERKRKRMGKDGKEDSEKPEQGVAEEEPSNWTKMLRIRK